MLTAALVWALVAVAVVRLVVVLVVPFECKPFD